MAKHSCGGPVFGRLVAGCARCDELAAGAVPVRWASAARDDRARVVAVRVHDCAARKCGPVCTFGDW